MHKAKVHVPSELPYVLIRAASHQIHEIKKTYPITNPPSVADSPSPADETELEIADAGRSRARRPRALTATYTTAIKTTACRAEGRRRENHLTLCVAGKRAIGWTTLLWWSCGPVAGLDQRRRHYGRLRPQ